MEESYPFMKFLVKLVLIGSSSLVSGLLNDFNLEGNEEFVNRRFNSKCSNGMWNDCVDSDSSDSSEESNIVCFKKRQDECNYDSRHKGMRDMVHSRKRDGRRRTSKILKCMTRILCLAQENVETVAQQFLKNIQEALIIKLDALPRTVQKDILADLEKLEKGIIDLVNENSRLLEQDVNAIVTRNNTLINDTIDGLLVSANTAISDFIKTLIDPTTGDILAANVPVLQNFINDVFVKLQDAVNKTFAKITLSEETELSKLIIASRDATKQGIENLVSKFTSALNKHFENLTADQTNIVKSILSRQGLFLLKSLEYILSRTSESIIMILGSYNNGGSTTGYTGGFGRRGGLGNFLNVSN